MIGYALSALCQPYRWLHAGERSLSRFVFNRETNSSFFCLHQFGRLAWLFDRLDGELDLDAFSLDLLWSSFRLGRDSVYARECCKEKYQHAGYRLQVAHRAAEGPHIHNLVIGEIENRTAQFRRLLKNEKRASVVLLDVLDLRSLDNAGSWLVSGQWSDKSV